MSVDRKICRGCGRRRSLSSFGKLKREKDGHDYYCKECRRKRTSDWIRSNPDAVSQYDYSGYDYGSRPQSDRRSSSVGSKHRRRLSDAHRKAIAAALQGNSNRFGKAGTLKGRSRSVGTRQRISQSCLGKRHSCASKKRISQAVQKAWTRRQ